MKIELNRIAKRETYTIGKLFIDGKYFCDTIEDVVRPDGEKVMHKTAIPAGIYKVIVNMSNRFKRLLPILIDVPMFDGIRIHNGVDETSSSGCIIVGKNTEVGKVTQSREYMNKITDLILSEQKRGIEITIKIK